MDEKPKTVKVKALQAHTTNGVAYNVGDEYDIPAELVDTVVVQGKAAPAEAHAPTPPHGARK